MKDVGSFVVLFDQVEVVLGWLLGWLVGSLLACLLACLVAWLVAWLSLVRHLGVPLLLLLLLAGWFTLVR
jgi:hypothetical protein